MTSKAVPKAPAERRGSFFDTFLQTLSPIHGSPPVASNIAEEETKGDEGKCIF